MSKVMMMANAKEEFRTCITNGYCPSVKSVEVLKKLTAAQVHLLESLYANKVELVVNNQQQRRFGK